MKHSFPLLLSAVVGLGFGLHPGSAAANAAPGQTKVQSCTICHGALGMSNLPEAPHQVAQPALHVSHQPRPFHSGEQRRLEAMGLAANPLSDTDIGDSAARSATHTLDTHARVTR